MNNHPKFLKLGWILLLLAIVVPDVCGQYFGRNKPRYRSFDFTIRETPHFSIYNYTDNDAYIDEIGQWSEAWYAAHQEALLDTLDFKNPLILYNNHPEFQQTNTISGSLSVGTGGVTEAFKNRVVLPFTYTRQQLHHVLGHELVHAFQYNIILNGDSTNIQNLGNVPLWLVEGLAEYLSIGNVDPHTAMWMRDAVDQDDIPSIKDLNSGQYFPYRYGQTFWSYITGLYGDEIIRPVYYNTAVYGLESTIQALTNMKSKDFSEQWIQDLKEKYQPHISGKKTYGKPLIKDNSEFAMQTSPSLSPNGKYLIYLTQKNVFSTDLYLADARSGDVIRKITGSIADEHLDAYNFLESSGTWSPRSDEFAFVAQQKGRNVLVIKDVESGKSTLETPLDGVPAFTNPAWSPDGKFIIVTGLVEGQTDLYKYELKSKQVTQLTNDIDAEMQVQFRNDGSQIVYATDNRSLRQGKNQGKWTFDIATMDMTTGEETIYDFFYGADNLNPYFDEDGNILFLSNRDGFRNLYTYFPDSLVVHQETDIATGISGITPYAPALSVAQSRDRVMYTLYSDSDYRIVKASSKNFLHRPVEFDVVDFSAGTLPGYGLQSKPIVDKNLIALEPMSDTVQVASFTDEKYKPKFKLDFATGGGGVGLGTSNAFGNYTGLAGGVGLLFSDMLGNNQIYSQLSLNGELIDFGGQVQYINREHQLAWGVGLQHLPLRTGFQSAEFQGELYVVNSDIIRIFDDYATGFVHYPFSTTLRAEANLGLGFRSFRYDQYQTFYEYNPFTNSLLFLDERRERIPLGDSLQFNQFYTLIRGFNANVGTAIVGDNSFFGMTAPLAGHRFRIGLDKYFGADDYFATTIDFRKYFWFKPVSIAIRGLSYFRFEQDVNTIYPLFVGNMGFVRGYGSLIGQDQISHLDNNRYFNQYIGSKIALANFEVRLPFTGPKQIALIKSRFLFTDLNVFADAGYAFNQFSDFTDGPLRVITELDENGNQVTRTIELNPALAASVGVSVRANVFGALILEPYMAWQLAEGGRRIFGLNIVPGW